MSVWQIVSAGVAIGIAICVVAFAFAVLIALFNGTINLTYLLAEPANPPPGAPPMPPKASLSRFQFLIFTFVIAGVYLVLCLESGTLVSIPDQVLWLLGISGGTYATSKGIATWGNK